MNASKILAELIWLAHELGKEERQLVMLGEGNLSANCGDGTFWVKASGSSMADIDESGFSRVRFVDIMQLSSLEDPSEEQVVNGLRDSLVDESMKQPSIETFLHAICLQETEAKYIAHSHPTAVLSILCSKLGAEPLMQHIFPEPIPVCGRAPAIVPYTDPGFKLAGAVRESLDDFREKYQQTLQTILMINHGLVALGDTAQQALNITLLMDKWARIVLGTYALGGPQFLSQEQVDRFADRLDESLRQQRI
jgi:rhamnose utilization protein RhaD (predicted bifunctional aldolase and dehydrogenase)